MSLLKRIERARPAAEGESQEPNVPAAVPPTGDQGPQSPAPTAGGTPTPPPPAASPSRFAGAMPARESFREAKFRVQNRLINELDPKLDLTNQVEVRRQIEELFGRIADEEGLALTRAERVRMLEQITDEILGLGPLEPLLRDETLTEVMVNGPQQVYIERDGKLELTNVTFQNDEHVMKIIERIIAPIGRRVDESCPMVDARLPDGSRVNAIIPPLSLVGPVITIRKFSESPFTVDDLIRFGTVTPEMFEFLEACVKARLNILVSGGTGSGKTTMLNMLARSSPRRAHRHHRGCGRAAAPPGARHHARDATLEHRGQGCHPDSRLVRNSLRMRPDRIIVGECRGGEALDMLQAMNTGHDGSMSTGHANTPRDMLSRLETMVLMAGMDLPLQGDPRADRIGRGPDRPPEPAQGRHPKDHEHHRGPGNGGRRHRDAGRVRLRADRRGRRQDPGQAEGDWHPAALRGTLRDGRHPPSAEHLRIAVLMLPILIAGLAALAVVVIAIGISMSAGGGAVASRLERYASQGGGESTPDGERESAVVAGLSRVIEGQDLASRLATDLARADLKMRPAEFIILWAVSPIIFVGAAIIIGVVFPGFQNPVALVVFFFLGAYFPRWYVKHRQAKRLHQFGEQLPDTITLLANSLRAGSSFLQGIELVTREARPRSARSSNGSCATCSSAWPSSPH